MYSLDKINDAISSKKQISFIYNTVGTDFQLHPKREREYVVNPYQIVANNGRFYLICNYDKYDNVSHYRIDRMTDVRVLDKKIKPMKDVPELAYGLNLPKHMAEHVYMFSGESADVTIQVEKFLMDDLVDWFGTDFRIMEENDDMLTIRIRMNPQAMRFWALQYGPYAEVLKPESLRKQIKEDVVKMSKKYK
jgi:predicted DNA-binding transcriptional regulator YafY